MLSFTGYCRNFLALPPVTNELNVLFFFSVKGYHSNMCVPQQTMKNRVKRIVSYMLPSLFVEESHVERLSQEPLFLLEESGYMHLQATKPDTVGQSWNA